MGIPKEFVSYLIHFHGTQDFFECHEILEEYWKEVDPRNKDSHWVAFILLAVSTYHHRRSNFSGAEKTAKRARHIIESTNNETIALLGINKKKLLSLIQTRIEAIQSKQPFVSFQLPIVDEQLLQLCQQKCKENGINWFPSQPDVSEEIIHRHKLRDRSEVIMEREIQLALRREIMNKK